MYDGTDGGFSMSELDKLEGKLKPWTGELTRTMALVCYTANTWMKQDAKQLSLNLCWVVVLASE